MEAFSTIFDAIGFQPDGWTLKTHQEKKRAIRILKVLRSFVELFQSGSPQQTHLTNVPIIIYMLITQLCVRASVRACLCACLWGSRWQPHNSSNSTADGGVLLLCYKHDKSLNHGSLIVPWDPNTSACCELIVTQREGTNSPRVSRHHMHPMALIY